MIKHATRAVVVYHDHCVDGFGAAWAFYRLAQSSYRDGTTYVPATYGKIPEMEIDAGAELFILDFSFSREVLVDLASRAAHVTVLDHHKTAQAALTDWEDKPANLDLVFDMGRSGARISWEYFADTPGSPTLIRYIEDRDLWRHELTHTKEFNAAIGFAKKTFQSYDALHNAFAMSYGNLLSQGQTLLEAHTRNCESIIKATKRKITIAGHEGLVCNCPGQFATDVGNILAVASGTFGATYFQDSQGDFKFSLRSVGDYDVTELAALYGGGGHKNAAGFSIPGLEEGEENVLVLGEELEDEPEPEPQED